MKSVVSQNVYDVLKVYPINNWPLIGAIAYSNTFTASAKKTLKESASFQLQVRRLQVSQSLLDIEMACENLVIDDLKALEKIFEQSLEDDSRKSDGAVYTPDYIIDFILEQVVGEDNLPTSEHPLLDPACGSGGFLLRAAIHISAKSGITHSQATKNLRGLDVNLIAVENAKLFLDLFCLGSNGELSAAEIYCSNSLLTPVPEQLSQISAPGGVSALVTNPPYVKLQTLETDYRDQLTEKYPLIANGSFTLATLFLYLSKDYLSADGEAGFITLNNIFTSLAGKGVREYWQESKSVKRIIDFRHYPVFEASAYTCLIFIDKKKRNAIEFNAVNSPPSKESLSALTSSEVSYETLNANKWRLARSDHLELLKLLESKGNPLGTVADIRVGFATLLDKAFMCELDRDKFFAVGQDGIRREIEADAVHRFLKVSELPRSEDVEKFQRGIIYPYEKSDKARPLIPWEEFTKRFPNAGQHLVTWQSKLEARGGVPADQWHQWGRRQALVSKGPKILTKTFDSKPTFALDNSDALFSNGYSVCPKETLESYSISQLKCLLESRFMLAYALMTSFEIQGGYQCYQKNFIEKFCLPPVDLLPKDLDAPIEPNSKLEKELCAFYGTTIELLESSLSHYLG